MTSADKKISVIIPTHNRKEILEKTVESLLHQSLPPQANQIMVIDDGSTDGTEEMIHTHFERDLGDRIGYWKQPQKGANPARNWGIQNAKGHIILFINDDTVPDRDLLEVHLKEHSIFPEEEVAILGHVAWSHDQISTPFLRWLDHGGPQFIFHEIKGKREVPWYYFVTANVSIKKAFVSRMDPFDEDFMAHQDTEFAWRAHQKGMKLLYNESALVYHFHPRTFDEMRSRMVLVGEMTRLLVHKHPDLTDHFKRSLRQRKIVKFAVQALGMNFWNWTCRKMEPRWIVHRLFREVLRCYFLQGYHSREQSFGH